MPKPRTFRELFEFYYERVKPLYNAIQLTNTLPTETLFEINAAFDHLSRAWRFGETEEAVVDRAAAHLKRSVLDIFKILVRNSVTQYQELTKTDISVIDNGKFERELRNLHQEIKRLAKNARKNEGDPQQDPFELWLSVFEPCVQLEREFYESDKWLWAKQRDRAGFWRQQWQGVVVGVLSSLLAAGIYELAPRILISDAQARAAGAADAGVSPAVAKPTDGPTP